MIQKILTEYSHLGPFHSEKLINHLAMAQVALWKMNYDEQYINEFSKMYISRWHIQPATVSDQKIKDIQDALGELDAYCNYVLYFRKIMQDTDYETMLRRSLNVLTKGLASGLFHGIIRTAYAVESGNVDEVCRALALYASIYHESRFAEKVVDPSKLKEALYNYHQTDGENFYMSGSIEEKEKALVDALSDLYLSTGNFFVLHTITGFHALRVLKPHFDNCEEVLDRFTVCAQRAIRRIPKDGYKKIMLTNPSYEWRDLFEMAAQSEDAHTIKFVYTCSELEKQFGLDTFIKDANIKVQLG